MTLQSSGPISLSQIASEFGTPADMSYLRGKGGTPSTGSLSFSNFYGKSNITFSPSGSSQSVVGSGNVYITLTCSQSATWTWSGFPTGTHFSTNIPNGGTGTAVQFRVGTSIPGDQQTATFTVHGSSGGSTHDWSCSMESDGPIT